MVLGGDFEPVSFSFPSGGRYLPRQRGRKGRDVLESSQKLCGHSVGSAAQKRPMAPRAPTYCCSAHAGEYSTQNRRIVATAEWVTFVAGTYVCRDADKKGDFCLCFA